MRGAGAGLGLAKAVGMQGEGREMQHDPWLGWSVGKGG